MCDRNLRSRLTELLTGVGNGVRDQTVICAAMTFTTRLHSARCSTLTSAVAINCIRRWWRRVTHMSSRALSVDRPARPATTPGRAGRGARTGQPAPFITRSRTTAPHGTAFTIAAPLVVGSSTSTSRRPEALLLAVGYLLAPPSTTRIYHPGRRRPTRRRWQPETSCSTPEEFEPVLGVVNELLMLHPFHWDVKCNIVAVYILKLDVFYLQKISSRSKQISTSNYSRLQKLRVFTEEYFIQNYICSHIASFATAGEVVFLVPYVCHFLMFVKIIGLSILGNWLQLSLLNFQNRQRLSDTVTIVNSSGTLQLGRENFAVLGLTSLMCMTLCGHGMSYRLL